MREQDLAARVVAWLTSEDWETAREVDNVPGRGKARADIVTTKAGIVAVLEAKLTLTWQAIEQARGWQTYAHERLVVTATTPKGVEAAAAALRALGIGWLVLQESSTRPIQIVAAPRHPNPSRVLLLLGAIRAPHRDAQAGTAGGGKPWTQGDEQAALLRALVAVEPGIPIKRAQERLGWDASGGARRNLERMIRNGQIDGVALAREGTRVVLVPGEGAF